jgi:hypothetical protein
VEGSEAVDSGGRSGFCCASERAVGEARTVILLNSTEKGVRRKAGEKEPAPKSAREENEEY